MRRRVGLGLLTAIALPFVAGAFLQQGQEPQSAARLFAQVLRRIEESAVDSLDRSKIYELAARGLIKNLNDPYADLYSPEELATFQRQTLRNNYGGLGMQIESQEGSIIVARVFPNTPSERGGVIAGDRIMQVDSTPVTGLRLEEVSSRMLGTPGTEVDVVFRRVGVAGPIKGRFKRAVVRVPAVPFSMVIDGNVGYIPLQSFNESAAADVESAIASLRQQGAKAFMIDLRGNGGGSLDQALEIGNLFLLPGAEIASVRHRGKPAEVYRANRPSVIDSMPIVVLVDGYSASAAEIVSGTLQDHDRALIVGTTSFGKGLVQTLFPLDGGWAVKLTTGKWYTPSGRSIQADHERLGDERFVEYENSPGDSAHRRPIFKSDGGRPILGGGGVTPDVLVKPDTLTSSELALYQAVGAQQSQWYVAIYSTALDLKNAVKPDFTVQPAWRETVWRKLQEAKVTVPREKFEAGSSLVDRDLEQRVSRLAFGDSAWFRRSIRLDNQVQTALEYLSRGPTQRKLLALAPPPSVNGGQ